MNKDRWKKVNQIFHAALEVSVSERRRFVLTASKGDPSLQAEVELLLKADEEAGSYLESPLIPEELFSNTASPVSPGDVLCGRFRILRAVGEGGMGRVFEAFDSELAVSVALKVIRAEIASNPEALARFRQEVRLARRITHPGVCRTFDIERETRVIDPMRGAKEDVVFLTMEFLDGETLASRIKRDGPLPLHESLELACQIGNALNTAHALGIVHRDIKPANIMLVPAAPAVRTGPRAVITDFGLAQLDPIVAGSHLSGFTKTARPIGTLAYMAPEQLESREISAATDIYGFGLVLFEMVTGKRAFPSENLLSGIAQRLTGSPPSPRSLVPSLPHSWCRSIEGCLRVRPTDRFQSVANVIEVLYGGRVVLRQVPKSPLGPRFGLFFGTSLRGLIVRIVVLLFGVSLSVGALRLYRSEADSTVPTGALVYLAPVKNETGEKAFDNVTELIKSSLVQSVQVNLLDQGRVGDTLQRMTKAPKTKIDEPVAREIAMRNGAVRVVFATLSGSAGRYNLEVDIQQPDYTPARYRQHWPNTFPWHSSDGSSSNETIPSELLSTVRIATGWIRKKVGESSNDIARLDVPPQDATTDNWQALADFVDAERLQSDHQTTKAIAELQNAIGRDAHFSLALGRLGDLLFSTGQYQEGYHAYERALESGQDRRLSRKERDRIVGEFALDAGDYATAEQAYRDITIYYDSDYNGWSYRGFPLIMLGRTDEALSSLERAFSIDANRANAPWELARANILKGNFPEALRWAVVLDKQGSPETANYIRGAVEFLSHNFDQADGLFRSMESSKNPVVASWSYGLRARVAAELGYYARAVNILSEGIAFDRQSGLLAFQADNLLSRAYVEALSGNYAACLRDVQASVALENSPQRMMVASSVLGIAHARAREPYASEIEREIQALERHLPRESFGVASDIARFRVRGELLLARGAVQEAIAQFRSASQLDAVTNGREYLARALATAAKSEGDPRVALGLRRSAMEAYSALALQPGLLWLDSPDSLPGCYTSQLQAYLEIGGSVPGSDEQKIRARMDLNSLRDTRLANMGVRF